MNEQKIRIKQYEQSADEKVSLGGIRWERKWDVCVQCDSREEAERVRAALTMKQEQTTGNVLMDAYHAMQAKKEAAQPEQEPVAHLWQHSETGRTRIVMPDQIITTDASWFVIGPLYLGTPPRRKWVGLTDDEIAVICGECAASAHRTDDISYARAIEAKLKEKNA